ncbi:MAG: FKBP-type peptidyl-prolyl cis-trans isomerase [Alistipes sp.]|nr:FKBP-type peptidyl-prolyl cis-trans isomerase [Alistipes sp.]
MKRIFLVLLVLGTTVASCSKNSGGGVKLKNDTDSIAYIIGMNVGMNLMRMDSTLRVDALCEGIRDVFRAGTKLSPADAETYYLRYVTYTLPEKARAYEEQFLADIAKSNRAYARTSSGVTYTVGDVGDQERIPTADRDTVAIRYVIRTADGRELYSSYERGDTLRCPVGDLRKGVRESLKLIGKGGRIEAWLPAATAYGAEGDAELGIAPNATLYYEMELIDVVKYTNRRR